MDVDANAQVDWTYLIDADRVPAGEAVRVQIDGTGYVVCNEDGTFHVTADRCPHAGGGLWHGCVRGGAIVCPVHQWSWDLRTGLTDARQPAMRLALYRCENRNGRIYADLSSTLPLDPAAVWKPRS